MFFSGLDEFEGKLESVADHVGLEVDWMGYLTQEDKIQDGEDFPNFPKLPNLSNVPTLDSNLVVEEPRSRTSRGSKVG